MIESEIAITKLLQASPHKGLQVQNLSGQWIDAPPIDGTFVVNIGKGRYSLFYFRNSRQLTAWHFEALEFATQGLARATSHRVLSPRAIPGQEETYKPRYSVPFFQNIRMDIKLAENVLDCTVIPRYSSSSCVIIFSTTSILLLSTSSVLPAPC